MATRALDLGRPSPRPNLRGGTQRVARSPRPTQHEEAASLRVVKPQAQARRSARQGRRLLITVCSILTVGLAFGVAISQVLVAQNQDRLDKLNTELRTEQERYDKLRFEVAELESPERVVAVAQERLGMIEPPQVNYVAPVASNAPAADATGEQATPDWRNVKSELAAK